MTLETGNSNHLSALWCVIPVYNNASTVREVVLACRERMPNVLVIDDGSEDGDVQELLQDIDVTVVRHERNQGKGRALLTALDFVSEKKGAYMITMDGDGQHLASDLDRFIPRLQSEKDIFFIGVRDFSKPNIPSSSKFGRSFANFWLRLEAGISVRDCQSGFRAYPVEHFKKMNLKGSYYDFETEALARAAWAGLPFEMISIDVFYPEKSKRVSSFHPVRDNWRISLMHSKLVIRRLLPIPHKKLVSAKKNKGFGSFFRQPVQFFKELLQENTTPSELAASAAVGIILATLPLLFIHTIAILYVTARLHLNKIMAVSIQNLCMPPFVPFLCIELGHFLSHGVWLTHVSKEAFLGQVPDFLWDWFLGSLIVAPVLALIVGVSVYFISRKIQQSRKVPPANASRGNF